MVTYQTPHRVTTRRTVRVRAASALILATILLAAVPPARADPPGWHERYMVNVICARTRCVRDPSKELPPGTMEYLAEIWVPLLRGSAIPADETIALVLTYAREPNAWAIKHYWGITAGLWNMRLSRDELAFVAAHELAHIELKHYERKLNEIAKIYGIAFIAIVLSQGNYNPLNDPYFATAVQVVFAAYSRELETDADVRAVRLMDRAGFNPQASISMLQRFESLGVPRTGDLFDDHPSLAQRVLRLRRELAVLPTPRPSPEPTAGAGPAPLPSPSAEATPVVYPTPLPSPPPAPTLLSTPVPGPSASMASRPTPGPQRTERVLRARVLRAVIDGQEIGTILIGGRVVMRVRTPFQGKGPIDRAEVAAATLNRLLAAGLTATEIAVTTRNGLSMIVARNDVLLVVDSELASQSGTVPSALATLWAKEIQQALSRQN